MKTKLIGLYQLITGIFGFILIASNVTKVLKSFEVFFTFFIGLLLFAGVAYSGYALLNSLRNAVKYSIWAQALQIISFTTGGIQYLFSGSAFLYLLFSKNFAIEAQIEPIAYNISGVSNLLPFELRIFIIPIIIVILLSRNKK
jgi:hypothetical protein